MSRKPDPNPAGTTGVDRRDFLRSLATSAAAAAVAGAVTPHVIGASGVEPLSPKHERLRWNKAPCTLCSVGCGLLVGVDGGRATAVRGDPDCPVGKGLACVKGYHLVQALYGGDRLTRAQVRRNGRMVPVPLSEALDVVAQRIRQTTDRHGAKSIALYGSTQWGVTDGAVANSLFREALGATLVDTAARLHSASAYAGSRAAFGLDGPAGNFTDIDHADVIVLWGANAAETEPVLFSRMLERRRTNPAVRIVTIGTRTTRTAYAADAALLHAPGTELAVLNAVAHEMVATRGVDAKFVERHVSFHRPGGRRRPADTAASWDDYARFVRDYPPSSVARTSGMTRENITWLASLYSDPARKVVSVVGESVHAHVQGTAVNSAVTNLHLLSGKVGAPGNGVLPLGGRPGGSGAIDGAGAFASTASGSALPIFRARSTGEVRFLWVMGANPLVSLPNLSAYRQAGGDDAFLVVSDAYPTATTALADVILPAALWIERDAIVSNGERRLRRLSACVEPPGDASSDASQMIGVAQRLGFGSRFPSAGGSDVARIWEAYRRTAASAGTPLPTSEALGDGGSMWPGRDGDGAQWRYATSRDPFADRSHGEFDFYGNEDHRAHVWLNGALPLPEAPDTQYPFWLHTGSVLEHSGTGTLTERIPTLHRAMPTSYVEMHADDARRLLVRDGDRVRLVSRRGSIELTVRIDFRSQPTRGALFVPSFDAGHAINRLTLDACCPISGQPGATCAVRVERLGGGAGT